MSKEKQIDEIAKLICTFPQCIHHNIILLAESKSEVAIEIIQDIAKACAPHNHHLNSLDFEIGYITAMNKVLAQLEEIKKKYTEG